MTGDKDENKCKFEFFEETCHREREPNSEFCICHLEGKDKNTKKFWDEVDKVLNDKHAKRFDFVGFLFVLKEGKNIIDFSGVTFSKDADFEGAKFHKDVTFRSAKFLEGANFEDSTFSNKADFFDTEFSKDASFTGAKFFEFVNFSRAIFSEKADFSDATFSEDVNFWKATFSGTADFSGTTFSKDAIFLETKFSKHVAFIRTTFSKSASFSGATFSSVALFVDIAFSKTKSASFSGATFSEDASFDYITFSKDAHFRGAKFSKRASFKYTKFKGKARFQESKFKASSSFEGAEFNEVYFRDASFDGDLEFSKVFIENYAKFTKTKFHSAVHFRECDFEKPERVSFNGVDLGEASFKNTDVSRIYFENFEWSKIYRRFDSIKSLFGKGEPRLGIYDEKLLKNKNNPKDEDYSSVETLYRQLKYNYEEKRNYPDAGEFYIGEMEMRRKGKFLSMLTLYRALSLYGEHYWLPFYWISGVLIVFGVVFILLGFEYNNSQIDYSIALNIPLSVSTLHDFLLSCIYVFRAITLQSVSISPVEGSVFSEFIQAILKPIGVVLFSLWALALRRRFRR